MPAENQNIGNPFSQVVAVGTDDLLNPLFSSAEQPLVAHEDASEVAPSVYNYASTLFSGANLERALQVGQKVAGSIPFVICGSLLLAVGGLMGLEVIKGMEVVPILASMGVLVALAIAFSGAACVMTGCKYLRKGGEALEENTDNMEFDV